MARLVISDQPKPRLEVSEPTTRRRINPENIEEGLGAEQVGLLPPSGSPISAYALRQALFRRLRSTGGRPGLDGSDTKPKIPMRRSQWSQLQRLAELVQKNDFHPTPAQLASVLLEAGIAQLANALAAEANANSPAGDLRSDSENSRMQRVSQRSGSAREARVESIPDIEGLPQQLRQYLALPHGAALIADGLSQTFSPSAVVTLTTEHKVWEGVGAFYRQQERFLDALVIYSKLYDQLLVGQEAADTWCNKGTPLVWMSECYLAMGCPAIAQRHLMLTLIDDAIYWRGQVSPTETGSYFRLVWRGWLSEPDLKRYAKEAYEIYQTSAKPSRYPEWILMQLDRSWMTQAPSPQEVGVFATNLRYIDRLVGALGGRSGKELEALAEYVLTCMPGCRTMRRRRSDSTDYDLICSVEGLELDFRSELGRYFVCECKDWSVPADFTAMAKFCRILDSVKSRFGILFSRQGISGEGKRRHAALEQLKVFQDRGIVIVVVDHEDLEQLVRGTNFISLLRTKYEGVRLNLAEVSTPIRRRRGRQSESSERARPRKPDPS
jgi:hypothetical protein